MNCGERWHKISHFSLKLLLYCLAKFECSNTAVRPIQFKSGAKSIVNSKLIRREFISTKQMQATRRAYAHQCWSQF